jgi:hypothetical protein
MADRKYTTPQQRTPDPWRNVRSLLQEMLPVMARSSQLHDPSNLFPLPRNALLPGKGLQPPPAPGTPSSPRRGPKSRLETAVSQWLRDVSKADLDLQYKVLAARCVAAIDPALVRPGTEQHIAKKLLPKLIPHEKQRRRLAAARPI